MRLITCILSSGIALTCVSVSASAQSRTFTQASIGTTSCPKNEGYPDCDHNGLARSTAPAHRQVAYGSLWRPSRAARQPR